MESKRRASLVALLLFLLLPATLGAQEAPAPYEGWRVLETDHFRFIYEPAHESAALKAAGYADEVYRVVTRSLDYYPEDVPVIIRGRTARANGYYTPFPHQVNLFVTSPSGPWLGARSESWLKLLFIHEFTHYCHFANRKGVLGGLSYLFGHDLTAAHALFYPGWLLEGITVTNESYYSAGGRGSNPFFRMKYEAFLQEGEFWSYKKSKFGSAYAPRDRIYVAGYLYVRYLRETYGEEVIAEIHEAFARAPILGIPRAVRKVTGVSARELHGRMVAMLNEAYEPDSSRAGRVRLSPARQGDWYLPRGTQDGWFYYTWSHEEAPGIWKVPQLPVEIPPEAGSGGKAGTEDEIAPRHASSILEEAQRILTVSLTDPYSFDVSGDGGRLLFTTVRPDPGHPAGLSSYSELYRLDLGTEEPVRLSDGARLQQPALSPDGRRAVVVERDGSHFRLLGVDPESGERWVLFDPAEATVKYPTFSEDGGSLAFVVNAEGEQDLIVGSVEREGRDDRWVLSQLRSLTNRWNAPVYIPRFAGSSRILFSSDPDERTAVYEADLSSGEIRPLLKDPVAAWGATPVGDTLVYGSYSTTGSSLWAAPIRSSPGGPSGTEEAVGVAIRTPAPGSAVHRRSSGEGGTAGAVGARYRDLPRPLLWFPLAAAAGTAEDGPVVSVGTFFLATSILQRHQLQGTLFYAPELQQPSLGLGYSYSPGPVSLGYSLSYQYEEDAELSQAELLNELTFRVPVWRRRGVDDAARFSSSWSLGVEQNWLSRSPFGLDELGRENVATANQVFLGVGGDYSRETLSAPKAFYGEAAEAVGALLRYYPELLDREEQLVESVSGAGVVRGLPWWHHAIGLSVRGGTSSDGSAADLVGPRGGPGWDGGDGGYEILPSLRYLIPLGLWEARLLGVNLLGGGLFLFGETSFYGDFDGGGGWGEEYYAGAELDVSMQLFNILPLLGTAGIVTRIDPESGIEDGWEDVYLYIGASVSIPSVSERLTSN